MIANRFLEIINNSLDTGLFPEKWKNSTVMQIPINNTVPTYEKILELINHQLV